MKLLQRDINYNGDDLKEPVFEGEPAKCVHHELPGVEVPGGVDYGGVTRHRAHGAQHLGNKTLMETLVRLSDGSFTHGFMPSHLSE